MAAGTSLREALLECERVLAGAGDEHAELSAEWLVEWVAGCTRAELYARADEHLELGKRFQLMAACAKRAAGEPLQYITGSAPFRALEIACEPGVLIPRPETELLVELALAELGGGAGPASGEPRVLDLCTGTGCIACAIASERKDARVWAVDVSPEAVALARGNVSAIELEDRVGVLEGDLFSPLGEALRGGFDLIVSNPPYVPSAVVDELPREVRDHEPRRALDGGEDGLDLIRRLVEGAPAWLAPGGVLALELFEGHADEAAELVESVCEAAVGRAFEAVRVERDLTGRPRFLIARRALGA